MKYLLIGIYLSHGSFEPQKDTLQFTSKVECQTVARDYIKSAVKGQKWAICAPLKGSSK